MNIETKLADNFGAAYDALDAAKKAYDNARKAVIQHGKPVLVGTSYTIEFRLKETLTFTEDSLKAVGFKATEIEALQRTTLDTPAVRKALKDKNIVAVDAAADRKMSDVVEAIKHPMAVAA